MKTIMVGSLWKRLIDKLPMRTHYLLDASNKYLQQIIVNLSYLKLWSANLRRLPEACVG